MNMGSSQKKKTPTRPEFTNACHSKKMLAIKFNNNAGIFSSIISHLGLVS